MENKLSFHSGRHCIGKGEAWINIWPIGLYNQSWYLSQPHNGGVVLFFQAGVLFSIENTNAYFGPFWQILAILSRMCALFGVLFTGLNDMAVYQNWQISGMYAMSIWALCIFRNPKLKAGRIFKNSGSGTGVNNSIPEISEWIGMKRKQSSGWKGWRGWPTWYLSFFYTTAIWNTRNDWATGRFWYAMKVII